MLLSLVKKKGTHTHKHTRTTKHRNSNSIQYSLFTSQVEMLSDNCSEWSIDRAYIPCPNVTIGTQPKRWDVANIVTD